jgi:hypothetical protein
MTNKTHVVLYFGEIFSAFLLYKVTFKQDLLGHGRYSLCKLKLLSHVNQYRNVSTNLRKISPPKFYDNSLVYSVFVSGRWTWGGGDRGDNRCNFSFYRCIYLFIFILFIYFYFIYLFLFYLFLFIYLFLFYLFIFILFIFILFIYILFIYILFIYFYFLFIFILFYLFSFYLFIF